MPSLWGAAFLLHASPVLYPLVSAAGAGPPVSLNQIPPMARNELTSRLRIMKESKSYAILSCAYYQEAYNRATSFLGRKNLAILFITDDAKRHY